MDNLTGETIKDLLDACLEARRWAGVAIRDHWVNPENPSAGEERELYKLSNDYARLPDSWSANVVKPFADGHVECVGQAHLRNGATVLADAETAWMNRHGVNLYCQ